ncbi:MAG: lytic transglycosylase domain-containing protein, partial [Alphaproteobacteria bacterium]|nr:lytic transglycosylase domain-containing protein [Alphaproteobacteria bacterium]
MPTRRRPPLTALSPRRLALWGSLIALLAIPSPAWAEQTPIAAAPEAVPTEELCQRAIDPVERDGKLPRALMRAIAVVESGRWIEARQAKFAWPWTINAEGEGRFFPTKAAAIAEVKRLRAGGMRSIDVGCMQVNLQYHPKAFADLDEAFDPGRNVEYAARFLRELHEQRRSWDDVIAYYHSTNAE